MNSNSSRTNSTWPSIGALAIVLLALGPVTISCTRRTDSVAEEGTDTTTPADPPEFVSGHVQLKDVTAASGISFRHTDGATGRRYLVEAMSAGLTLFDFDGDGLIDIYFVNGTQLPPGESDALPTDVLLRNEGDWHFRDVTQQARVGCTGFGLGGTVGDYNNDGYADLYVSNCGPNVLYRNNGDGTFTDVTAEAGVAGGGEAGAGACFLDSDADGDLDLYVASYIQFEYDSHVRRTIDGFPCYPGPLDHDPAPDILYRNNGDGTFTDVSQEAGISGVVGTGMGMICVDYDNDRDTDIFVANDELANFLFENDGSGKFSEVGVFMGVAYDLDGHPKGNMGADCADYDNDGWLDFFITSYSRQMPSLYKNLEGRLFRDVTLASGAGSGCLPHVKWGAGFADFDNDTNRDLFIACGHLDQEVHRWNTNTSFRVKNLVLRNMGNGTFQDLSAECGDGLQVLESSRGIGLDDLDIDGDVDVVILNSGGRPTLLQNDTHHDNGWIEIRLHATESNRDGVGAHVCVTAGGLTQLAEVHSGRGYQSHHGQRLHFGLGNADRIDRIEVSWIGGGQDILEGVRTNQIISVIEGSSSHPPLPLPPDPVP
jgi:hypothetical protein